MYSINPTFSIRTANELLEIVIFGSMLEMPLDICLSTNDRGIIYYTGFLNRKGVETHRKNTDASSRHLGFTDSLRKER